MKIHLHHRFHRHSFHHRHRRSIHRRRRRHNHQNSHHNLNRFVHYRPDPKNPKFQRHNSQKMHLHLIAYRHFRNYLRHYLKYCCLHWSFHLLHRHFPCNQMNLNLHHHLRQQQLLYCSTQFHQYECHSLHLHLDRFHRCFHHRSNLLLR